ncbi:hypothetical protein D3C71_1949870 [compost metagenome]
MENRGHQPYGLVTRSDEKRRRFVSGNQTAGSGKAKGKARRHGTVRADAEVRVLYHGIVRA